MKTTAFTITLIFFFCLSSPAQRALPAFGEVDRNDLLMTDCDFDKGAEAVKLLDLGEVTYDQGYGSIFTAIYERRVRIKILKEKGLSQANVVIQYDSYDDYEQISKFEANTYNIDDGGQIKTIKVSKSSIYKKRLNGGVSELIIAFPEVKVGSIIEYKYKMTRGASFFIDDWNFQGDIPVKYSQYRIDLPSDVYLKPHFLVTGKLDILENGKTGGERGGVLRKTYVMQNLIGIKQEPFTGSVKDYHQRIEFLLTDVDLGSINGSSRINWSRLMEYVMKSEYFGKQFDMPLPKADDLINQCGYINDLETRIRTVFQYVQQNVEWNGIETLGCYDGVKAVLENKVGSNADINILLLNLLQKAKIQAYPILFSTRKNGLVNLNKPKINQFNAVMAYVPAGDKYYVLDASDKFSSFKLIPADVTNTKGFLLQGAGGRWIEVSDNKNNFKIFTAIKEEIGPRGEVLGDATVNCYGYARKDRCKSWIKNKEDFKKEYFSPSGSNIRVEDIIVSNVFTDSLPLEQKVKFSSTLTNSGDYYYFTLNMFSGLDKNPFIADERITDIEFGYLQNFIIVGRYLVSDAYSFEDLPKNISLQMPDRSIVFTRFVNTEEGALNVRMELSFKKNYYPAGSYAEIKEFFKKLHGYLDEQIVVKKK